MRINLISQNNFHQSRKPVFNQDKPAFDFVKNHNLGMIYYMPVNFKKRVDTQKLWEEKSSIKEILDSCALKYNTSFCGENLKAKDLVNNDTVVLGETLVYDKETKKNINCCLFLLKKDREYIVAAARKDKGEFALWRNDFLAEIRFKVIKKEKLGQFFKTVLSPEETQKIIKNEEKNYVTIIGGFINHAPNRYINAGKKTGLCAMQLFEKCNIENLYFCAFPTEGSASPIPYYLRAQFKPLNCTEKDILKKTDNFKKRLIQTEKIPMIMPKDAQVLKLAKKYDLLKDFLN